MSCIYNHTQNRLQTARRQPCGCQDKAAYLRAFRCILNRMIEGMTTAELSDSVSHNFIVRMIPHHRAAIEMSENILRFTDNCTISRIAADIIDEQTKSIADMEAVLPCCSSLTNTRDVLCRYRTQIEPVFRTMFSRMQTAGTAGSVDCCFLREMLPHHEGAVAFSEITLRYDICPQLKPILDAIIESQERGIRRMQQLLCSLKC